jgi:predicted lactoylglutathione lyase
MAREIYVNLPVRDLERSKRFFSRLGFGFEPKVSDDNAACMIVADNIHVMLLTEPFFRTFSSKAVCDTKASTEVLVCLSCESDAEIDGLVAKAAELGGKAAREPKDHGFMYEHAFEDPDGHTWELVHMRQQSPTSN